MNALVARVIMACLSAVAPLVAAQAPTVDVPADQSRAQAAIGDLGQRLKGALMAKMKAEGPVAAVDFCHEEAPKIAQAVSAEHGVTVGRTALRVRSPANAPAPWQAPVLAQFLSAAEAGTPIAQLVHVERDADGLRLAKAIPTDAPCLVCHGSHIAEPIRAAIAAKYPEDAATGFAEGQLRGMFWAQVPAAAAADARTPIPLGEVERASLRAEMRVRMETLSAALSALAAGDWDGVARLGRAGASGQPKGADFRPYLPEGWFAMARPMHQQFSALADEAGNERRMGVALKHLSDASSYCVACHAAYRTEAAPIAP